MEKELLINKLLFNIRESHITVQEALGYAYGAGFDEKVKVNGSEIPVEFTDKNGNRKVFPSISLACRKLKIHRSTISESCRLQRRTRKGYYFRYADENLNEG